MTEIEELKKILLDGEYTCVIKKGDEILKSNERGIKPVLEMLKEDENSLSGAIVCDKVIGRAAALLFTYGRVIRVHAAVISQAALEIFEENGVAVSFDKLVDRIQNRNKTGLCPMETIVMKISDPNDAYEFFNGMNFKG